MVIDDVQTLILHVLPDSYPILVWPNKLGFPKTVFETPEDATVSASLKVSVPQNTTKKIDGADLELTVDSKTLLFADVDNNKYLYNAFQVRGSEHSSVTGFYDSVLVSQITLLQSIAAVHPAVEARNQSVPQHTRCRGINQNIMKIFKNI
jgi:hypothetical protein